MREAVGNTFIVNLIIIFILIFIILFAGSTSYTKAYKVKNRIIDIIEENKGYNAEARSQIDRFLGETGYRVTNGGTCRSHYGTGTIPSNSGGYRYCVETFVKNQGKENEQTYYGVTSYMYFEIPIIASLVELPVYGETKSIGIIGN